MANNTTQKLKSTGHPLTMSIGRYTDKIRFAVCPLNYDIILGKKWTTEHHAVINCYTNKIRFSHKGKFNGLVATDPKTKQLISVNAITRDHSKNHPCTLQC